MAVIVIRGIFNNERTPPGQRFGFDGDDVVVGDDFKGCCCDGTNENIKQRTHKTDSRYGKKKNTDRFRNYFTNTGWKVEVWITTKCGGRLMTRICTLFPDDRNWKGIVTNGRISTDITR